MALGKENAEFVSRVPFNPIPKGDWIDMAFVLEEVEGELRTEVLAIALETMANVHANVAEGARKVANAIRGTGD